MLRTTTSFLLALGLTGTVLAHDYHLGELAIDEPWARATAPQQRNGAAYLRIVNEGADLERIVAVESPIAERVELHTHDLDGEGVMRMREVEAIDLPPGEVVELRPGGLHVMLIGLADPLVEGETFPLVLIFEHAEPAEIEVRVESVAFGIGGDHEHDPEHDHEYGHEDGDEQHRGHDHEGAHGHAH